MKTLTKLKHTPLPWKTLTMSNGSRNIIAGTSEFICQFSHVDTIESIAEQAEVDAQFIIKAVNSHDELLGAAKSLVSVLRDYGYNIPLIAECEKIISKAQGES